MKRRKVKKHKVNPAKAAIESQPKLTHLKYEIRRYVRPTALSTLQQGLIGRFERETGRKLTNIHAIYETVMGEHTVPCFLAGVSGSELVLYNNLSISVSVIDLNGESPTMRMIDDLSYSMVPHTNSYGVLTNTNPLRVDFLKIETSASPTCSCVLCSYLKRV